MLPALPGGIVFAGGCICMKYNVQPLTNDNKMISKTIEKALNTQINAEFWSAYLYLAMSADMAHKNYKGMANWYRVQHQEELDHAYMMMDYLRKTACRIWSTRSCVSATTRRVSTSLTSSRRSAPILRPPKAEHSARPEKIQTAPDSCRGIRSG